MVMMVMMISFRILQVAPTETFDSSVFFKAFAFFQDQCQKMISKRSLGCDVAAVPDPAKEQSGALPFVVASLGCQGSITLFGRRGRQRGVVPRPGASVHVPEARAEELAKAPPQGE